MMVCTHWWALSENTFLVIDSEVKSGGNTECTRAGKRPCNFMTRAVIVSQVSTKTVDLRSVN